MSEELLERAREGLEAWQRGDVSALEPLLAPDVELLWWEAGDWDCRGRDAVLSLLRERSTRGADGSDVELIDAGGDVLIVSRRSTVEDGPQAGTGPATVITFRDGRALSMRQFPSLAEARAAAE